MDIKRNNKCLLTPDKCPRLSCAKHFDGRKFLISYYTKIFSSIGSFFIEIKTLTWLFVIRIQFFSSFVLDKLRIILKLPFLYLTNDIKLNWFNEIDLDCLWIFSLKNSFFGASFAEVVIWIGMFNDVLYSI